MYQSNGNVINVIKIAGYYSIQEVLEKFHKIKGAQLKCLNAICFCQVN